MENNGLARIAVDLPDATLVVGPERDVCWLNHAAQHLLGGDADTVLGTQLLNLLHPEDRHRVDMALPESPDKVVGPIPARIRAGTEWLDVELSASASSERVVTLPAGVDPNPDGDRRLDLVVVVRPAPAAVSSGDNGEDRSVDHEPFRSLIHNAASVLMLLDRHGTVESVSAAITRYLGHEQEQVEGRPLDDVVSPHDRDVFRHALRDVVQRNPAAGPLSVELELDRSDGPGTVPFELSIVNLLDDPAVNGLVVSAHDISQLRTARAALERLTVRDQLTGVANRALILDRLEQMLVRSRRTGVDGAVLFVDLDGFKQVNDRFGHRVGDDVLRRVARRFEAVLGPSASLGRHGGDEFVVLVDGPEAESSAMATAERLLRSLDAPFAVKSPFRPSLSVSASIGVVSGSYKRAEEMLVDADLALAEAKTRGCGAVRFETSLRGAFTDRLDLERSLAHALDGGQFFLVYQPVLHLDDGSVGGVEALLRWRHPERGVVPPADFVPALEDSGLIVDVGAYVLREACRQVGAWHRQGFPVTLSVNVSARQLQSDRLVVDLDEALSCAELDPGALILDVADRTSDTAIDPTRLAVMRDRGVRIAIDGFGTGPLSLACLQQVPVDVVKIDRSFVAGIGNSAAATALVRAVIDLGTSLAMDTVAQGIEQAAQLDRLRREGCPKGQGFLFCPPLPATDLERFLVGCAEGQDAWWWPVERAVV